jgi:hypothetical protein
MRFWLLLLFGLYGCCCLYLCSSYLSLRSLYGSSSVEPICNAFVAGLSCMHAGPRACVYVHCLYYWEAVLTGGSDRLTTFRCSLCPYVDGKARLLACFRILIVDILLQKLLGRAVFCEAPLYSKFFWAQEENSREGIRWIY